MATSFRLDFEEPIQPTITMWEMLETREQVAPARRLAPVASRLTSAFRNHLDMPEPMRTTHLLPVKLLCSELWNRSAWISWPILEVLFVI